MTTKCVREREVVGQRIKNSVGDEDLVEYQNNRGGRIRGNEVERRVLQGRFQNLYW